MRKMWIGDASSRCKAGVEHATACNYLISLGVHCFVKGKDPFANQCRLDLSLVQPNRPLAMRSLWGRNAIRVLIKSPKPPNLPHTHAFRTSALFEKTHPTKTPVPKIQ